MAAQNSPLSLSPENSHYIQFRGKPTILLGSTEHYGAVLNSDFDYVRYLDAVRDSGLNLTRIFSGAYVEPDGAFNIVRNTLAPVSGKFIAPWARSDTPGYANGRNKFDLMRWNDAYFARLHDFVAAASSRGIVIEIVLFCPYYEEPQWSLSPLNVKNNVNGAGDLPRTSANTLDNGKLLEVQDAMVRKFAAELKSFDNIYYEICNEPYFGGVTIDWQMHIAQTLADAETALGVRHLIAQNIANKSKRITQPSPLVSIFNFHYATPPDAVTQNFGLNKVIADDETGFKGTGDAIYRMEAWDFFLAGGGIFDHLDYSFTAGHEDGSFMPLPAKQPGGGGPELRKQFRILKDFLSGMNFTRMKPDETLIRSTLSKEMTARVLAEQGKTYAIYMRGTGLNQLDLKLPPGSYRVQWIDTRKGPAEKMDAVTATDANVNLVLPKYEQDIAIRIDRS
ncbi:MAG TPA: hypothetical protein VH370_09090 [Humisphaera sp.]|nr:hypothetical protein [Humisphaera sp.]